MTRIAICVYALKSYMFTLSKICTRSSNILQSLFHGFFRKSSLLMMRVVVETKKEKKRYHVSTQTSLSFRSTGGDINNFLAAGSYLYIIFISQQTACRTGEFDVLTPLRLSPCLCVRVRLPVCACDDCCSNSVLLIKRGLRARKYTHTNTYTRHITTKV